MAGWEIHHDHRGHVQFSAKISLDDHQDFIAEMNRATCATSAARESARALTNIGRRQLFALVLFAGSLGYLLHRRGLDDLLQRPLVLSLVTIGLLCVPVAIVWQLSTGRLRRNLEHEEGDKLDPTALRDGLNLGRTQFDLRPDGLQVTLELVRAIYPWEGFQAFRATARAFYLMLDDGLAVIVPKRAFADEAARRHFEEFVAAHIGAGR